MDREEAIKNVEQKLEELEREYQNQKVDETIGLIIKYNLPSMYYHRLGAIQDQHHWKYYRRN